ncbi:hypothetical protein BHM03_00056224, partial [Ensete ventricosum]
VEDNLLHTSGSRRRLKCLLGHRNRPFSDSPHESSNCESLFRWLPLRRTSLKSTAAASSPCPSPSAPNRSSSLAASLLDSASSFPLTADTPAGVEAVVVEPKGSQERQPRKRVIFGLGIRLGARGVVVAGGWVFTVALAAAVLAGAREYFELVRSRGIAKGMTPPPRYVSRVCSIISVLMPMTL